jgi:hypothetical protein
MIKRIITIVITLLGLSFGITHFAHTKFIDYSFLIGLGTTVILWFSTSKGGSTSRFLDASVQGATGIKNDQQKFEFSPNYAFFTALAYTVITVAAMLYHYRS